MRPLSIPDPPPDRGGSGGGVLSPALSASSIVHAGTASAEVRLVSTVYRVISSSK